MSKISELTTRRNKLIADATSMVQAGLKTSDERTAYKNLLSESDGIQEHIDMLSELERKLPAQPAPIAAPVVAAPAVIRETSKTTRKKLHTAYRSFLQHGHSPHLHPEQRDLTISDGSAIIPQSFDRAFTQAQKWYGPIATLVKQSYQETGAPRKLVVSDDTNSTMTYLAETGSTSSLEEDPTVSSTIPGTDALVTVVKYSLQELADASDLEDFLRDIAGVRVATAVDHALVLGKDNGSNTQLPNSPTGGLLANVSTGATTGSLAAGIGYDDLVSLATSVNHAYFAAPGSGFMASPSTFAYLLSQKDGEGRPFYKVDPKTGLLQIAGKPLYISPSMPAYNAASSPVVLFGDFSRAYAYLNGGGIRIQILRERYVDVLTAAMVIHHRLGAATLVSGAVKALVTAAS